MAELGAILRKAPRWTFTILVGAAVCYLTLWPDPTPDIPIPLWEGVDKLVHAVMFGGLMGAVVLDQRRKSPCPLSLKTVFWDAIGVCVFGLIIELLQRAMGLGRGFEWMDWGADSLGVGFACLLAPPVADRLVRISS